MGFGSSRGADWGVEGRVERRGALSRLIPKVTPEKFADAQFGNGRTEKEPLRLGDGAQQIDHPQLLLSFYALDHHAHAEPAAHRGDAFDQYGRALLNAEPDSESAIDLDAVEREAQEIAETRVSGAEIVERNAKPSGAQGLERAADVATIFEKRGLSDFKVEALGRKVGGRKRVQDRLLEIPTAELRRRQIHRHADSVRPRRRTLRKRA